MEKPDICIHFVCFFALKSSDQKFFGFSEFVAALALLVLVWTVVDTRFTFRIASAPLPIERVIFGAVAVIGFSTLLTDLWRAEEWYVPHGPVFTPGTWQAFLGTGFLIAFLLWAWFVFVRPPTFGRANFKRFEYALTSRVLRGSQLELSAIAAELQRSARNLVEHASRAVRNPSLQEIRDNAYVYSANRILHLIADRRFCKALVEGAPGTIVSLFLALREAKNPPAVGSLARNILRAALASPESFLFHETDLRDAGLLGHHKPVTAALFGSHRLCDKLRDSLDLDYLESKAYSPVQWEAYSRCVLLVLKSFMDEGNLTANASIFYRACDDIKSAARNDQRWRVPQVVAAQPERFEFLSVASRFLSDAINLLDECPPPHGAYVSHRSRTQWTVYDVLAELGFELICIASTINAPANTAWTAQHNIVWGRFMEPIGKTGRGAGLIRKKIRRLVVEEVRGIDRFPHYKNVPLLGMCLNVMGIRCGVSGGQRETSALRAAILGWVKKNYGRFHREHPHMVNSCLVDGFTFDAVRGRLWRTNPMETLRRKPRYVYMRVDA